MNRIVKMKFICESCLHDVEQYDKFCSCCGDALLDAVTTTIVEIKADKDIIKLVTNLRVYGYDTTKPLETIVESWKGLSAKEVALKATRWLEKSKSPGAVIQGFKKSYELAYGSVKDYERIK